MKLTTNKWQSFEYDLNNAILNKYNFIILVVIYLKVNFNIGIFFKLVS